MRGEEARQKLENMFGGETVSGLGISIGVEGEPELRLSVPRDKSPPHERASAGDLDEHVKMRGWGGSSKSGSQSFGLGKERGGFCEWMNEDFSFFRQSTLC